MQSSQMLHGHPCRATVLPAEAHSLTDFMGVVRLSASPASHHFTFSLMMKKKKMLVTSWVAGEDNKDMNSYLSSQKMQTKPPIDLGGTL